MSLHRKMPASRRTAKPRAARSLGPGGMVALIAIAAVAAALVAVHAGGDAATVTAPRGAHAGQLTLAPCSYHGLEADCGTLIVPENRHRPGSRLIALPITRIHSRSSTPTEPIFRLMGGPGLTNMDFPYAGRYIGRHDLVLVGFRGVDGSSVLNCPEVESAQQRSGDLLSARSLRASSDAFGDCARRLRAHGTDVTGYSLSERVDDLESARRALHYPRVDLLSESAGTRTALIYAWRYPDSVRRSVMIGVNPPGHFLFDEAATNAQLHRFSSLSGSGSLVASMTRTARHLPSRWGVLPIRRGNVLLASFFGLADASREAAPISAPMTLDTWLAASRGDASGMWFESFAAGLLFPRAWVWGDAAAVGQADAAASAQHFAAHARGTSPLGDAANRYLWDGGGMLRHWPANTDDEPYTRLRASHVETLLVGGTVDGETPLGPDTSALLRHLPNGHQVVLRGFGHTTDFWTQQTAAGTRLIDTFLDRGTVDDSAYVPQRIDFSPSPTQSTLAELIIGAMLALATLALTSMLWLARRARRRRPFGAKTTAYLRSMHASLVGLGGWLLAALVAMVARPDMQLDAGLLLVASIGVTVGLTIHWVSAASKRAPSAAACAVTLATATVGAWAGVEAARSPLSALTAIAGAVAAANLGRLVQDALANRAEHQRAAAAIEVMALAPA